MFIHHAVIDAEKYSKGAAKDIILARTPIWPSQTINTTIMRPPAADPRSVRTRQINAARFMLTTSNPASNVPRRSPHDEWDAAYAADKTVN